MKDGLLLIDKEPGLTSHDVVQRARRLLKQKKIGHCGTLDPDATGLLLLTLGTATRLTRFLIRAPKIYHGVIRFGFTTDTYDATGKVVRQAAPGEVEALTQAQVAGAMRTFVGAIEQRPPAYSAKKVNGVKFYEMARRGEEVPEEPKEVTVYEFEATADLAEGRLAFRLGCSSGTYARALAHDLGNLLGPGAHLAELRRIKIGGFHVDAALTLAQLHAALAPPSAPSVAPAPAAPGQAAGAGAQAASAAVPAAETPQASPAAAATTAPPTPPAPLAPGAAPDGGPAVPSLRGLPPGSWMPFDDIPLPFGEVTTDSQQELRILHGQTVLVRELAGDEGDWVKLVNRRRQFIAIGTVIEKIGGAGVGIVQPKVVFR